MPDADDPGVVRATVVERVDPNLATEADSASLESTAPEAAAAAPAIRISCYGKERREEGMDR